MKNSTDKILLSICIPTYNRSIYLRKTLLSIVNQDSFASKCEIVISDNNSSDDTKTMVNSEFIPKYKNIRYYCNEKNIGDKNFVRVMNLARGEYIKLHGDRTCFEENKLVRLLYYICNYDYNVFFTLYENTNSRTDNIIECKNFDQFVQGVSFFSTWITGIIFRTTDYMNIKEKERYVKCQLSQTDILFRMLSQNNGHALIINEKMFNDITMKSRGGYNLCDVFIRNYLWLYQDYLHDGTLSKKTYRNEKIKLLNSYILPIILRQIALKDKRFQYDLSNTCSIIFKYYWYEPQLLLCPFFLLKRGFSKIFDILSRMDNHAMRRLNNG